MVMCVPGGTHWFLKHESGFIFDATANQFESPLDYSIARGCGFLTADILTRRPEKSTKFNCIYFDIWPDICTDNFKEMSKLHRAFKKHAAVGALHGLVVPRYSEIQSTIRSTLALAILNSNETKAKKSTNGS